MDHKEHSYVGLERQLMIHTITLQRLMKEYEDAKLGGERRGDIDIIKTINTLNNKISKEKQNIEDILIEGENIYELDPTSEYDILAHQLLDKLNDEEHYLV